MAQQQAPSMGYQPGLDGVRAVSVAAVILYHAGFSWMHGGFFGVEVFFVVSGYLITSLLLAEREQSGTVDLRQFWHRRWRRLLPALFTMLVAVSVWAVFWGSAEQHSQMRRDLPWSILYVANWGQIAGDVPYFSPSPPLLRHLWSLAVEEQWYVLWPLVFIAITRRRVDAPRRGRMLALVALAVMVGTAVVALWSDLDATTTNFLYLSTITRCTGLLLGAAAAFVWRPWRITGPDRRGVGRRLDTIGAVAAVVLVVAFLAGRVTDRLTYVVTLPLVSVASLALIAAVVHPWSTVCRPLFSARPLVEVGKRSYGLYLWSWPISRICDAYTGSASRFALAMAVTVPVSEVCYRFVETPIRRGALGRWWRTSAEHDRVRQATAYGVAAVALLAPTTAFFATRAPAFDRAVDSGGEVEFETSAAAAAATPTTLARSARPAAATTTTVASRLPRRVVLLGDSQAHSIAVNLPRGIGSTFKITNGAVEGCSVYDTGIGRSTAKVHRTFTTCAGWEKKWTRSLNRADAHIGLVVLGAWDVLDVELDGKLIPFGSPQFNQRFMAGVQRAINTIAATGATAAMLEIACMRPINVQGAAVSALPERGDDARIAQLNVLLREVVKRNPGKARFVVGPKQWCADPAINANIAYRWDGVHVYKPGAKLILETISKQLLAIR